MTAAPHDMVSDRIQTDPAWFVEHILGGHLWATQKAIAESVRDHEYTAVPSCHSSGKSHVAARIALWFLYSFLDSKVITTAPTSRQVEGILWPEIHRARARALVPLGGKHLTLELKPSPDDAPDWYAMGFTAPDYDPNRFQGFHAPHILVVVDEAAGVTEPISDQIASLLSGGHPRRLDIGNPVTAGSPFQRACESDVVNTIHISAFDTPNFTETGITIEDVRNGDWKAKAEAKPLPYPQLITPNWVAQRWAIWGEDSEAWRTRVLGQFPEVVVGAYYGELMQKAADEGRIGEEPLDPNAPVYTAWDIGVKDNTAIWFWQRRGEWVRFIDYHEDVGQSVVHYIDVLQRKSNELGYKYSNVHIAPHDFGQREFGNSDSVGQARSALHVARDMGVQFRVLGKLRNATRGELLEGIDIARRALPRCRFDEDRCKDGISALQRYKRAINKRTGEPVIPERPEHDENSHGADAFRYACIGMMEQGTSERPEVDLSWIR